jgi:hypothetical protein
MGKRNFLITGHGRSGTNYMAALFQWFGYEVGAQSDGKHGMSHNFPPMPDWKSFRDARQSYRYLIQVVRNPYKVVESTFLAKYSLVDQNAKRITEIKQGDKLEQAIRSVVLWNKAIQYANPDLVVQVEHSISVCREWLSENRFPVIISRDKAPRKDINKRTEFGWNLDKPIPWETVSESTMDMLSKHCIEYGYEKEEH